jgi:hypothetical protein
MNCTAFKHHQQTVYKVYETKPICFVPVISDVIETPEQINIRLRKAIENKYKF